MKTKARHWLIVAALSVALAEPSAQAQTITSEAIVQALKPKPKTRSFGPSRGIDIQGGDTTEEPASIDLYVHFEYDQSALTMSDAQLTVDTLGKALNDERLAKLRFKIVGHTDARGNDAYNDALSRRRAEAVQQRLVQFHKIDGSRLSVEGKGRRELKDASRPEDGINRRVQIISISDQNS